MRYLIFALFISCNPVQTYNPVLPEDTDNCSVACDKLEMLGCKDIAPPDLSCTKFCEETQKQGHALDVTCVIEKVRSCDDLDHMEKVCQ